MRTIQTVMATTSQFCMSLNQLRALIIAARTVVTAQADLAVLDAAFDSVSVTCGCGGRSCGGYFLCIRWV